MEVKNSKKVELVKRPITSISAQAFRKNKPNQNSKGDRGGLCVLGLCMVARVRPSVMYT